MFNSCNSNKIQVNFWGAQDNGSTKQHQVHPSTRPKMNKPLGLFCRALVQSLSCLRVAMSHSHPHINNVCSRIARYLSLFICACDFDFVSLRQFPNVYHRCGRGGAVIWAAQLLFCFQQGTHNILLCACVWVFCSIERCYATWQS